MRRCVSCLLASWTVMVLVPGIASAQQPRPRVYQRAVALCIGIEQYLSPAIDKVQYATNDAKAVAHLLETKYGYETKLLLGTKATRTAIESRLSELCRELGTSDVLIVYFAGHGHVVDLPSHGRAGYLIPYDADLDLQAKADPERWEAQALDMRKLAATTMASKARHVLMLVDACCSGFMTKRGNLIERPDLQELAARRSRVVVAATTENQFAFPSSQATHGIFTSALLRNLDTESAQSLTEVFLEVRKHVVSESKRLMLPQQGSLSHEDGELVFIPLKIPEAEVGEAMSSVDLRIKRGRGFGTNLPQLIEAYDAVDYRHAANRAKIESLWKGKLDRFERNASLGDVFALAGACLCHAKGLGGEANPKEAYRFARLAYETGHPAGIFALAYCYAHGLDVQPNREAARTLLTEPSAQSFALNKMTLADILRADGGAVHGNQVRELLEQAAQAKPGVGTAALRLVEMRLAVVKGSAKEIDSVIRDLEPIAENGHPLAQFRIYETLCRHKAALSEREQVLAKRFLTQAAENGWRDAQYALAAEYYQTEWFQGRLQLPKDYSQARRWATPAAAQNHAKAHQMLAMIYLKGQGTAPDTAKAQQHYDQSKALRPDNIGHMAAWWLQNSTP